MVKKYAQYDNPAGYGHGGLGWHHSLDALPDAQGSPSKSPSWAPWAALAGAGVLGFAGLKGLGKVFRRAPQAAKSHVGAGKIEMLGRGSPRIERMGQDAAEEIAARKARMAHAKSTEPYTKSSMVIPALGRIARGE